MFCVIIPYLLKVIKMTIKENELLPEAKLFEYNDQKINSFDLSKVIKEKKKQEPFIEGDFEEIKDDDDRKI